MPGNPFQSQLKPHAEEIHALRKQGVSYRRIAQILNTTYGLQVSHNAVYSFTQAKTRKANFVRHFYDGFDPDIKAGLLKQITALWTHGSNAIEGNTLTLGETVQVIELGLTISGKPLKDHQEAYGHARAIDLIRDMTSGGGGLEPDSIFKLHTAVLPPSPFDVMKPIGHWKREYNGTTLVVDDKPHYMEYAAPTDVPALMTQWLKQFNRQLDSRIDTEAAIRVYTWAHMSFVRIHPFYDGNGRMARLLANIPVLRAGHCPILISPQRRGDYINILWRYQSKVGTLKKRDDLLPDHPAIAEFQQLLRDEWQQVTELVAQARALQSKRV